METAVWIVLGILLVFMAFRVFRLKDKNIDFAFKCKSLEQIIRYSLPDVRALPENVRYRIVSLGLEFELESGGLVSEIIAENDPQKRIYVISDEMLPMAFYISKGAVRPDYSTIDLSENAVG
jgi:hypothetical protein